MSELIVKSAFQITNRGTAVLFVVDPVPWWAWKTYRVRVTKPNGEHFEAHAQVEFARIVPPGEVMGLLFPEHAVSDIPIGSGIELVSLEE